MYINYYSTIRQNLAPGQFEGELAYQKGRIVTKQVPPRLVNRTPEQNALSNEISIDLLGMYGQIMSVATTGMELNDYMNSLYHSFSIPKHSGGLRTITAPCDALKAYQSDILDMLLKLKVLPHNAAHGFTKHRNCKTALEVHKKHKSRWFLKLDIQDFFPSIDKRLIKKALKSYCNTHYLSDSAVESLLTICTKDGALPQGAPTSPLLSNLVMIETDVKIQELCKANDLVYTRYADDILISGSREFDWESIQTAISTLLQRGMTLKTAKTRYGSFNGRNWNLGLMFNNNWDITVGHANKKKIKNMIHRFNTMPAEKTDTNMFKINGLLGYYKFIEPNYFGGIPFVTTMEIVEQPQAVPPIRVGCVIQITGDTNHSGLIAGSERIVKAIGHNHTEIEYIVDFIAGGATGGRRYIRPCDCVQLIPPVGTEQHRVAGVGERIVIVQDTSYHSIGRGVICSVIESNATNITVEVRGNGTRLVRHCDYNVIIETPQTLTEPYPETRRRATIGEYIKVTGNSNNNHQEIGTITKVLILNVVNTGLVGVAGNWWVKHEDYVVLEGYNA